MKTVVTPESLGSIIEEAIPQIATHLPDDISKGLVRAYEKETHPRGKFVLEQLVENARIASQENVPLCQDTGSVWVCLEAGPAVELSGSIFSEVDQAVAKAYDRACLRKSVVKNALFDRTNTGDNTPAFCEVKFNAELEGARLHLMLKGGGSDNASRVVMLPPSAGKKGIIDEVLTCVREKAANACPPLVIGVGIGATFDKVASLAKHALMVPLEQPHRNEEVAAFEQELLSRVNETGIGPNGLGGDTTALAVKVNTAPCHIAALPLAINMGCSAIRRITIDL